VFCGSAVFSAQRMEKLKSLGERGELLAQFAVPQMTPQHDLTMLRGCPQLASAECIEALQACVAELRQRGQPMQGACAVAGDRGEFVGKMQTRCGGAVSLTGRLVGRR